MRTSRALLRRVANSLFVEYLKGSGNGAARATPADAHSGDPRVRGAGPGRDGAVRAGERLAVRRSRRPEEAARRDLRPPRPGLPHDPPAVLLRLRAERGL